jgi:hypothetical protein
MIAVTPPVASQKMLIVSNLSLTGGKRIAQVISPPENGNVA